MRVVLATNGLLYGGAERIVEALALGLTARGDRVHVVATTRDGPIGETLRARGIEVSVLGIQSAIDARVAWRLASVARKLRAEVIHSHLAVADLATAAARFLVPRVAGVAAVPRVRIVSTVHSAYLDLEPMPRRIWKQALRTFDRVLAVSDHVRGLLPRELAVDVVRPSLIDETKRVLDRREARAKIGVPQDAPLVMAVGRLVGVKAFEVLARAAELSKTPGLRVIVVGDGPEREKLAAERSLQLLGARDDAGEIVAAADVVAQSSKSEGFPQAPLHAMAAGVPVVATRVGGTPEVVINEETGFLVPPDDPRALAVAIDALFQDRERARRFGEAGRSRLVSAGLTKSAMVDRTRAIYAELLS